MPKYTAAQLKIWKKTHRDFRSGSTRAGTALVQILTQKGSTLVGLEQLDDDGFYNGPYALTRK